MFGRALLIIYILIGELLGVFSIFVNDGIPRLAALT